MINPATLRIVETLTAVALGAILGAAITTYPHRCEKDKLFDNCEAKQLEGKITRHDWQVLGWSTDPTEKAHNSGDFWCKLHIDGNGEGCRPWFIPGREDEEPK